MTVLTGFHNGGRNYSWSLTRAVATRASTVFHRSARSFVQFVFILYENEQITTRKLLTRKPVTVVKRVQTKM